MWPAEEALLGAGCAIIARVRDHPSHTLSPGPSCACSHSQARAAVTRELGFTCSAGVAANKMLAKLCGGLHKPNQQTVLPARAVHALLDSLFFAGAGRLVGSRLRKGSEAVGLSVSRSARERRRAPASDDGGVKPRARLTSPRGRA